MIAQRTANASYTLCPHRRTTERKTRQALDDADLVGDLECVVVLGETDVRLLLAIGPEQHETQQSMGEGTTKTGFREPDADDDRRTSPYMTGTWGRHGCPYHLGIL